MSVPVKTQILRTMLYQLVIASVSHQQNVVDSHKAYVADKVNIIKKLNFCCDQLQF